MNHLRLGGYALVTLFVLMLTNVAPTTADVQPAPAVGQQIRITDIGVAGVCFDTLRNMKLSERHSKIGVTAILTTSLRPTR